MMVRTPRRGRGFWYGLAIDLLWPFLMLFTVPVWRGGEHIPRTGGVLLACNHVSFLDPIEGTAFVLAHRRIPRYLAKAQLWRIPLVGRVLAGGGHIPVHRGTSAVAGVYDDALAALERGETVVVYPEGTFTDDPDGWPMRGKTGVARMALATGVPVIPIAHWGGHHVLPRGRFLPRLLPRKTLHVTAGPPVDLAEFTGPAPTQAQLAAATAKVMAAITDLLADTRGRPRPHS
jgi:1-acyl-sn-glycerol-3-phosphate acyltransferase